MIFAALLSQNRFTFYTWNK